MQIEHIQVDNFKSLAEFSLRLAKFNCLIGLNGSGKSTVLQFLDFLAQQFRGNLGSWLDKRHWSSADLNSKLTHKINIDFRVLLRNGDDAEIQWEGSFNRRELRCTKETIAWDGNLLLAVKDGRFTVFDLDDSVGKQPCLGGQVTFAYEGSILSQMKEDRLPQELVSLKRFFHDIYALDMLSPELLRLRARESGGSLGLGGERLSAFLDEIGWQKRKEITEELKGIYPQLQRIDITSLRSGWKQLKIAEAFGQNRLTTEAPHVSDGLLRMLAVFAQLTCERGLVLLDEIENGINPESVEILLDHLVETPLQVLVTTDSPLILNYLTDAVAEKGVVYLYKDESGCTQSVRFFDIPSMREKLKVMGPGEAYEDTRLNDLLSEIMTMPGD